MDGIMAMDPKRARWLIPLDAVMPNEAANHEHGVSNSYIQFLHAFSRGGDTFPAQEHDRPREGPAPVAHEAQACSGNVVTIWVRYPAMPRNLHGDRFVRHVSSHDSSPVPNDMLIRDDVRMRGLTPRL
jgi:hypothetical protein